MHNCFKYFCSKIEPNNSFSVVPKKQRKNQIKRKSKNVLVDGMQKPFGKKKEER